MSKTTSKELSIELKEAGAKQESELYRDVFMSSLSGKECIALRHKWELPLGDRYSTFDCHELLEGLPITIEDGKKMFHLTLCKYSDGYVAAYRESGSLTCHTGYDNKPEEFPVEALGKLKLWCLREDHCNE